MLVRNKSIYSYYLKNNTMLLPPGSSLTVSDATWLSDDQLARTIETLDHAGYVSVTSPPDGYPRTSAFPDVVNIIGGGGSPLSYLAVFGFNLTELTNVDVAQRFDYPAEIKVGSDITLSANGLNFTIETDGWYELFLLYEFIPVEGEIASKGAGTTAWFASGYDPERCPIWDQGIAFQSCFVVVDGSLSTSRHSATHHMPASFLTAGTTLQVMAKYIELVSGSIQYSADAWIQRTA